MTRSLREARARITADMGADAFDEAMLGFECPSCGRALDDENVIMIHPEPPRAVEDLERAVERLRGSARTPKCPDCETATALSYVWVHAFHPTAKRDLVLRWSKDVAGIERVWWDPGRGEEPATLDAEQVDALLRVETARALSVLTSTRPQDLVGELSRALSRWPGEQALWKLLPNLLELGEEGLAGAVKILDDLTARAPDDPRPILWRAELVMHAVEAKLETRAVLAAVPALLERAHAMPGGDCEQAHLLHGNLLRLRGETRGARGIYEQVLQRFPGSAQAHYNVGLIYLEQAGGSDPEIAQGAGETALWHFDQGRELDPSDADYLVGRARALLVLGRLEESRRAVSEARNAHSSHPELKRVERALEMQGWNDTPPPRDDDAAVAAREAVAAAPGRKAVAAQPAAPRTAKEKPKASKKKPVAKKASKKRSAKKRAPVAKKKPSTKKKKKAPAGRKGAPKKKKR